MNRPHNSLRGASIVALLGTALGCAVPTGGGDPARGVAGKGDGSGAGEVRIYGELELVPVDGGWPFEGMAPDPALAADYEAGSWEEFIELADPDRADPDRDVGGVPVALECGAEEPCVGAQQEALLPVVAFVVARVVIHAAARAAAGSVARGAAVRVVSTGGRGLASATTQQVAGHELGLAASAGIVATASCLQAGACEVDWGPSEGRPLDLGPMLRQSDDEAAADEGLTVSELVGRYGECRHSPEQRRYKDRLQQNKVDACSRERRCLGPAPGETAEDEAARTAANQERLENGQACIEARMRLMNQCFSGGDEVHRDQVTEVCNAITRCRHFLDDGGLDNGGLEDGGFACPAPGG